MFVKGSQPAKPPKRVLLIQLGDIGDVVLSLPLVAAVQESFADVRVAMLVRDKATELARCCPLLEAVYSVAPQRGIGELRQTVALARILRRQRFDWVVDLRTGTRGALLARLSGAPHRIAYFEAGEFLRNACFQHLIIPDSTPHTHILDYNLQLLGAFGCRPATNDRPLLDPAPYRQTARDLLEQHGIATRRPLIAIQPFSLWPYKEWSEDNFAACIDQLQANLDAAVVLCGTKAEHPRAERLQARCRGRVHNLAGTTSLGTYAALLEQCDLLISVDSAGPHIAAAVATPTVTIYGPSSPRTWAPRGPKHRVVQGDAPCVPCCRTGCNGDGRESRCLATLPADRVVAAAAELLDRTQAAAPAGKHQ